MQKGSAETLNTIKRNILLADYTTYKIGGSAKYFFIAKTKEDLMSAIGFAKRLKLPVFILGGGSNLLVSDKGFNGLVIKIDISEVSFQKNKAFVGAGADLTKLAYMLADTGLSGLEWSAGVPGTVGGAIYGNAQAFGTKISDTVETVEALNLKTLRLVSLTKKQCQFFLKNSIFKKYKNLIIISAVLKFKKKNISEIKKTIKEFINYRKIHHPIDFPSAGSTFVNPEAVIKSKQLLKKFPELNEHNKKGTMPAGYLISKCGLAGKRMGKAQVSEKHANFIINLGGAKAKDVLSLIKSARSKVQKTFGISLQLEVQLVGFDKIET